MIIVPISKKKAMFKKITALLIFAVSICYSQHKINGQMEPVGSGNWVVLYQLKGAKQLYLGNASLENGKFELNMPENSETGMYRLLYDIEKNGFIDFIYNNKNVNLVFDPSSPLESVKFSDGDENSLYVDYMRRSEALLEKMDSIQIAYLTFSDSGDKESAQDLYQNLRNSYNKLHNNAVERSDGLFAQHLISSSKKFIGDTLHEDAQLFFNERKEHYFDYVDFQDKTLLNAIILSEYAINYVFYLNRSDDAQVQALLYRQAVDRLVEEIGSNQQIKKEILTVLLHTFAQLEEGSQVDYIVESHYNGLPEEMQDNKEIDSILESVKLATGRTAPDFSWETDGKQYSLHQIQKGAIYVLVFWSTDCSHCLVEIPLLHDFTKDKTDVHVISFALERDRLGFDHHTQNLSGWTHILGLEKWDHPTARLYEIRETPTYFVLDGSKKIIAKPEFFRDVKTFYESK